MLPVVGLFHLYLSHPLHPLSRTLSLLTDVHNSNSRSGAEYLDSVCEYADVVLFIYQSKPISANLLTTVGQLPETTRRLALEMFS